jgi:hypothetical protein
MCADCVKVCVYELIQDPKANTTIFNKFIATPYEQCATMGYTKGPEIDVVYQPLA